MSSTTSAISSKTSAVTINRKVLAAQIKEELRANYSTEELTEMSYDELASFVGFYIQNVNHRWFLVNNITDTIWANFLCRFYQS